MLIDLESTPERDERQLSDDELRMLRAVIATTACDAARFGFASNAFHRCQVRAWRVGRSDSLWVLRGSVPVELIVTRHRELLSHEIGPVSPEAFDD